MDEIVISKPDHSNIHIETDPGIEMEINDRFSFFVNNYMHMPKYKYGVWDGKIKLMDMRTKLFPAGLLVDLLRFAKERDYNVKLNNQYLPVIRKEQDEFELNFPISDGKGNKLEPRDYQIASVNKVVKNKRALILSPTGSGKSLIIYMLMRHYADKQNKKCLLIVPTTALVEQMYGDFQEYSSLDTYTVDESSVHRIYAGHDKNPPDSANIVVSTWQSLHTLPANYFLQYDVVIGDEVHLFKAKSLSKIMSNLKNTEVRVGTTGTLDGKEVNEMVLRGHFGSVFTATTTKELMDKDTLAKISIDAICLKHQNKLPTCTYHEEVQHLVADEKRNTFIARLALSQKTNTLVLFNHVDTHGKPLYDLICELNTDPDRPIFYISGEVKTEVREAIRHAMEEKHNAILCASFGTVSTGINIKNLHNIIFAAPSKSLIRVLQSIGRGLRKYKDFKLKLYDIMDDYSGGRKKKNYAYLHGIERLKIYAKQKFNFKIHNVKI